ncbi:MAG: tetratricopeptide repeat protein, partial [Pseudomonadales bacterium]|nr:tetratricopeptide repeat protein [Pseudomonadales bacterium]
EALGYEVSTWTNSHEALETFEKEPEAFDLQFKLASFYIFNDKSDVAVSMYRELLDEKDVVAIKAKNRLAYLLEKMGKNSESEALVAEVLKDHPGNIEALTLRGSTYLKKADAVNAISDLRTVLNANPENVDVIKMLGNAHLLNDEPELTVDMYRGALNLRPKDIPLRLQLATVYKQLKQLDKAAEQLLLADRIQANNPQIIEALAQVYMANNEVENAKTTIQRLMNLNTTNPRAFHYYGLVMQTEGDHEKAVSYFDESLRLKPGAIEPMSSKVRSLIALEKMEQAIAWLSDIANEQKDNAVAYNLKGELLLAKKSYGDAVSAFSKANQINPSWWVPYRNRALAAVASGGQDDAVNALREGVDKTKGNIRLRAELANVAEQQNDIKEAIHQYEKIIETDSSNTLAANNLAMLLVTYDEDNEKSLLRAQELSGLLLEQKNPLFQDTAGWVHYVSGQYEKALPIIKRAFVSQPENPEIQYHLGMTYFKINDKEKAKQHLAAALESDKGFRGMNQAKETLALLNNG